MIPSSTFILASVVVAGMAIGGAYFKGRSDGDDLAASRYAEAAEIQRRNVRLAEQRAAEATERLAQAREALSAAERRARRQGPSSALSEAQAGGLADVLRGE